MTSIPLVQPAPHLAAIHALAAVATAILLLVAALVRALPLGPYLALGALGALIL